jgi:O-antigen/teichoic acid export membrane protein
MTEDTGKLVIRSSIARTFLMVIGMIVAFFMMPFMIRKLGDTWYGILTLLQTLTGYYYFVDFGLATAVSRYISLNVAKKDSYNTNVIINTSLCIYVLMALAIAGITLAVSFFARSFVSDASALHVVRICIIVLGLNLALEFPFKAFAGLMGAFMRYDLLTYSHFLNLALSTALTYVLLVKGYGILALCIAGLVCSQISNIIFYAIAKHLFPDMRLGRAYFKTDRIKELLGYSIWSFVMQLGEQMRFRVDAFVIGYALASSYVTHFTVGANIATYLLSLIFRATNFLTPLFTKYFAKGDYDEIRGKLLIVTKINTILAVFGGGMAIMIGQAFLTRWMGEDYLDAYPVMVVLVVAVVLETIQNPSNNVLMAISKHRFFAIVNVAEGLANLGISIALVGKYGILGVALGTLIPLTISRLVVLPIYVSKCIQLSLRRYYMNMVNVACITLVYLISIYILTKDSLNIPDYSSLAILSVLASLPYLLVIIFLFLNKSERSFVRDLLPFKVSA